MKKISLKKLGIFVIFILGGVIFIPHFAEANAVTSLITGFAVSGINNAIAGFANFLLMVTAWFVAVAGTFLNLSISITLHIKEFYSSAGITSIWVTIRDLSSMFIIFALLYYSILTIVGKGGSRVSELIVKVFLAGMFINFSLFFAKVGIDASNLVSLQFYNAIAPNSSQNWSVGQAFQNGGISDVFMNNLKLPTIYKSTSPLKAIDIGASVGLATVGGILLMITAAFSFLAAAVAFTVRTGILLFLMALSPLYFVGIIFPRLAQKVSSPLMEMYKNQLLFMPAYLALLYVALRLISDKSFQDLFNPTVAAANTGPISMAIIIQYVIAIIFINAPLVAAIALGGIGMKWAPDHKAIAGRLGGLLGRNTAGRATKWAGEKFDKLEADAQQGAFGRRATWALRKLNISQAVRGGLEAGEKSKYGGKYSLEDLEKDDKARKKVLSNITRKEDQKAKIGRIVGENATATPSLDDLSNFRKSIASMDVKELEKLNFDKILSDPRLASAIPSSKFESLVKSEELTFAQQQKLKDAREAGFKSILDEKGAEYLIREVLKNKPNEIAKLPGDVLTNPNMAQHLDPASLRKMIDEGVKEPDRVKIRENIQNYIALLPAGSIPPGLARTKQYLDTNFLF